MKFSKWVETKGGAEGLATLLGIKAPRIRAWLRGQTTPQALLLQRIVKLSRGALTYDDVINETKKKRVKK